MDFFVGPEVDKLRKVSLDEGRVVELNNQAKHAVTNRWSKDRVHLILDYVEVRLPVFASMFPLLSALVCFGVLFTELYP